MLRKSKKRNVYGRRREVVAQVITLGGGDKKNLGRFVDNSL